MPVSLSNSIDIVANSVSLIGEDSFDNILDLFLKKTDAIQQIIGVPPETLNTIQKLAESINNDGSFFRIQEQPNWEQKPSVQMSTTHWLQSQISQQKLTKQRHILNQKSIQNCQVK